MLKKAVRNLLNDALEEREDLFLIEFSFTSDNTIKVIIDGDNGVLVSDCMFISRAIEHNLDREEHDFSLEVASAGATTPLTHKRQYIKNIGRNLEVITSEGSIIGNLTKATEKNILVQWKAREPKPIGKGKVTVQKEAEIAYENIVEAKIMVKF